MPVPTQATLFRERRKSNDKVFETNIQHILLSVYIVNEQVNRIHGKQYNNIYIWYLAICPKKKHQPLPKHHLAKVPRLDPWGRNRCGANHPILDSKHSSSFTNNPRLMRGGIWHAAWPAADFGAKSKGSLCSSSSHIHFQVRTAVSFRGTNFDFIEEVKVYV